MKSQPLSRLLLSLAATCSLTTPLAASASSSDIVGGWYATNAGQAQGNVALTFLSDGSYFLAEEGNSVLDPSGQNGMERGTYSWNASTGALSWATQVDTNGQWGLSNTAPGATFQIAGNTMTVNSSEGTTLLTRVTDPGNPIVGSWDGRAAGAVVVTFLGNGDYFLADDGDPALDPTGQKGMERGTYGWNAATGAFSSTTLVNTDGQWGLSNTNCTSAQLSGGNLTLTCVDPTAPTGFSSYTMTSAAPVPVPAAAWLFGSGLIGLMGVARKQKQI